MPLERLAADPPSSRQLLLLVVMVTMALVTRTTGNIDMDTSRLGCHEATSTYNVTKPLREVHGRVLGCYGSVTVTVCGGRCDTSEIPDHQIPYKLSFHRVCSYHRHQIRNVQLAHCDVDYPDRSVRVLDAHGCVCQLCNPRHTSCQTLN